VTIELLPPEVQLEGLNAFRLIGTEEREVLERRPASHLVVRLVRKKFVRKPWRYRTSRARRSGGGGFVEGERRRAAISRV